jgi:hypothetical protein
MICWPRLADVLADDMSESGADDVDEVVDDVIDTVVGEVVGYGGCICTGRWTLASELSDDLLTDDNTVFDCVGGRRR